MWGYLVPMDGFEGHVMVLRRRAGCPVPSTRVGQVKSGKQPDDEYKNQEVNYEKDKADKGVPAGGYLIGRHRECGEFCKSTIAMASYLTSV